MFLHLSVSHSVHRGGRCAWLQGGACVGYDEIQSMSGRYVSYWNAFLLPVHWTASGRPKSLDGISAIYSYIQISEPKFCPTSLKSHRIKLPELEQLYQILFAIYILLYPSGGVCLTGGVCLGGGVCPGYLPRGWFCHGGFLSRGGCLPRVTDFLTHACEIINFPQLRLRTVKTAKYR